MGLRFPCQIVPGAGDAVAPDPRVLNRGRRGRPGNLAVMTFVVSMQSAGGDWHGVFRHGAIRRIAWGRRVVSPRLGSNGAAGHREADACVTARGHHPADAAPPPGSEKTKGRGLDPRGLSSVLHRTERVEML